MRFLFANRMSVGVDRVSVDIWPLALIVLGVLLLLLWRRKRSPSYLFCCALFGLYVLFAVDRTFFPLDISGAYADHMRQIPFMSGVNLKPFAFGTFGRLQIALPGLFLNVMLTIPFGFGVNFLARIRPRGFLWMALVVGFGIETVQLVISLLLRYPYRVIDVDDALMNTLGVWIGYAMFRVFARLYVLVSDRFGIKQQGLPGYVYKMAAAFPAELPAGEVNR